MSVRVTPDVDPWLTLTPTPLDGAADASVHLARVAQAHEREQAIADALPREAVLLRQQQMLDSLAAVRVEAALPPDLSAMDRRDAASVAVRLHDPRWQQITRYHAADALLLELRTFMADGHGYATDRELRALADRLAGVSHTARVKVWIGQATVSARTWTRAALGFLNVTEDK